jgi:hypothetical protein
MSDSIPIAYDTDPNYFDLSMPDPLTMENAEKFMDWLDWQQSLVPDLFKGDPWQIYDLEAYQAFISDYISVRTQRERDGESIYPQDRPFIS